MICYREDVLKILSAIDTKISVDELDPKAPLSKQGVDSLDLMNIFFP
jgi:acyl carrier protein